MGGRKDMTGQKHGRATVIDYAFTKGPFAYWRCLCSCGNEFVAAGAYLRNGTTASCGCLAREVSNRTKHGHSRRSVPTSPEYRTYHHAKTRCQNPASQDYKYYGGRGIEFRFASFPAFLDEVGDRPTPEHSLDRIDVNGHYEAGNVRWATKSEQMQNRKMKSANGLTGVSPDPRCPKRPWLARISVNGKR